MSNPSESTPPEYVSGLELCVDKIIAEVGKRIVLTLPLGLGKANLVANALYRRAQNDSAISLHIFTALTLETPIAGNALSQRFLQPIIERTYRACPELLYATARRNDTLPDNIQVSEFFLNPGLLLDNSTAQRHYISSNYTHAARDLADRGVNVLAQMVAPHPGHEDRVSLSCNPDVTLELDQWARRAGKKLFKIAQLNRQLPYLHGEAEIPTAFFDLVVGAEQNRVRNSRSGDQPHSADDEFEHPLFPVPLAPVTLADYAIATHVSSLIKDGGTLQIGIGSMGDSVAYMVALRHHHNALYQRLTDALISRQHLSLRPRIPPEINRFEQGLYANSEMLVEGLIFLRNQQILTREVFPDARLQALLNRGKIAPTVSPELILRLLEHEVIRAPLSREDFDFLQALACIPVEVCWEEGDLVLSNGQRLGPEEQTPQALARLASTNQGAPLSGGHYCHAGFYLGSKNFYRQLHELDEKARGGLNMCPVVFTNHLYGDEALKRAQRRDARYINSGMLVTLTGAVVSDGLADYRIVSGVGGQHNFVSQAQELDDGRSVICLYSTRTKNGKTSSNIVWDYPHNTVARHLRDIVVTEYGVADLRGLSDRDVITRLLNIADSRFQAGLMQQAKDAGKLESDYRIPATFDHNSPQALKTSFATLDAADRFPHFPLGSDFTASEMNLTIALKAVKTQGQSLGRLLPLVHAGWRQRKTGRAAFAEELQRMELDRVHSPKHLFFQLLLLGALGDVELERPLVNLL